MKFSLSWLKDYLETDSSVSEIAEKLTNLGLETESVTIENNGFVIAKILEVKSHPNADALNVCMVDTGTEVLQIVCGAPNVKSGMKVVLANVGCVIPTNNLTIQKSKIRGVVSNGMLCSERELGLGKEHDGILEVSEEREIGENFFGVDPVFDVAITPNRGDCLGILGIARDLSAAGVGTLRPIAVPGIKTNGLPSPITFTVDVGGCSVIGCYISGVQNTTSPEWLQKRLQSVGIKPISALVDVSNYLTIALNRPMHVYDADKINGQQLNIRKASDSDNHFIALNEKEYHINVGTTVIADDQEVHAIAGVIGGQKSGCSINTTNIFLEVAIFDPIGIANASRNLAISTDASYRFERGIDPNFMIDGAHVAIDMIVNLCGGQIYEPIVVNNNTTHNKISIPFDIDKIHRISGMEVERSEAITTLKKLGFSVEDDRVIPPSWRHDVDGEADLVEEILRIKGYDEIPSQPLPYAQPTPVEQHPLSKILMRRGLHEVITWSFMDANKILDETQELLRIKNPITENLDVMRPSIIPNLIEVMSKNFVRDEVGVAIFELGPIYNKNQQMEVLAGLRAGMNSYKNIYDTQREYDIFDAKADVLEILASYNLHNPQLTKESPEYYHPGRSGCFRLGKTVLAYFGELSDKFHDKYRAVVFEIFIDSIPNVKKKKNNLEFSVYQAVKRDFAFVVQEGLQIEDLLKVIQATDKKLIQAINIFDIYRGDSIGGDKKSVALSVKLQASDRTLSGEELEKVQNLIIDNVRNKIGGILRESTDQ